MGLFRRKQDEKSALLMKETILTSKETSIWEEEDLLELDYITSIHNISKDLTKQNEEFSMITSKVAVQINENDKNIKATMTHLDNVDSSSVECINKVKDIISKDKTTNENIIEAITGLTDKVELLLKNIDDNNKNIIKALDVFCSISDTSKSNISQLETITSQVKLVALNARIEAARAGESGRGFGVVADEIQKLANQSEECTNEFSKTMTSINEEASTVQKSLKHEFQAITNQGEVIGDIIHKIESTVTLNTEKSIDTCQMLNTILDKNITEVGAMNTELLGVAKFLTASIGNISDICEKQASQKQNLYELVDISKQLKDIKSN